MTVSVVIPAYQAGDRLLSALESVFSQTRIPDEVLVVDDGSTDGAPQKAMRRFPGIRNLHQPNGGAASARNRGIAEANCDAVAFIDADDLWPSDALRIQVEALEAHPAAPVVLGRMRVLKPVSKDSFVETDFERHVLHLGAGLFRRGIFAQVGGFDTSMKRAEDLDWWMRAKLQGVSPHLHPAVVYLYRHHDKGLSGDIALQRSAHIEAVRRAMRRHRGNPDPITS